MQEAGYDAVLFEPGLDGAQYAVKRGVKYVFASLFGREVIREGSASAVVMLDVLEHLEDDVSFLKEIHELLGDQAKLYITVPAFKSLWSYNDDQIGHFRRYNEQSLRDALRSAGFSVKYATYFFSFLYLPIFLIRRIGGALFKGSRDLERSVNQGSAGGSAQAVLKPVLAWERRRIDARKKIPFGSSLLVIAQKTEDSK